MLYLRTYTHIYIYIHTSICIYHATLVCSFTFERDKISLSISLQYCISKYIQISKSMPLIVRTYVYVCKYIVYTFYVSANIAPLLEYQKVFIQLAILVTRSVSQLVGAHVSNLRINHINLWHGGAHAHLLINMYIHINVHIYLCIYYVCRVYVRAVALIRILSNIVENISSIYALVNLKNVLP